MERRDFIKNSLFASGMMMVPQFLKGMSFLNEKEMSGYKNVVIIQFSGGNDGLNSIIPYSNNAYYKLRPFIAKRGNDLLTINEHLAFNSALKGLHDLYKDGHVCVLNNVGYPNPNRSHFRSMDIWQTGSNSNEYYSTGWLGRYLDANCQNPYEVLEANSNMSLALKGSNMSGMAVKDAKLLYNTTREPYFKALAEHAENEMLDEDNMGYLYKTMVDTYSSAEYIFETSKIYQSSLNYPNTAFGKQLKNIGQMIVSGLKTRVYYVSLGGFDTHVRQVGQHERLLKTYSEALFALVKDLKKNKRFKDTLIMTFSEFGRRVKENGSRGTDHGTASNVYIVGGSLKKAGIYNELPNLSGLDGNGDLKFSIDFRRIYATILNKWLEVDSKSVLNRSFEALQFV